MSVSEASDEISSDRETAVTRRRVIVSSYLGTTLEYYDFLLYGTAAALVFNKVFFSNLSPLIGTIVAFCTLAAGYAARIVGAILFGHFGDRLGRKKIMVTTMIMMGLASGLIGCLPTYAQIGGIAPVLLVILRLVQGVAVGGEYGGAVLMAAEHSRSKSRGLSTSAVAMGAPTGSVLGTGAIALISLLPDDDLIAWGWRIPFLASFVILLVAMYFRARVPESPIFEKSADHAAVPIVSALRRYPTLMAKAAGIHIGMFVGQAVFGVFLVSYAPSIGYTRSTALLALLFGGIGSILIAPVYGSLSDRLGRKRFVVLGSAANAVFAYPGFMLINHGNSTILVMTVAAYITFIMSAPAAACPALLSELFPTEIRYTAVSTSYQVASTLGAGFTPLIAASLLAASGGGTNTQLVAALVLVAGIFSAAVGLTIPETRGRNLT